jgi:PBP1b-binding outer membrane lipoprotein LpoB
MLALCLLLGSCEQPPRPVRTVKTEEQQPVSEQVQQPSYQQPSMLEHMAGAAVAGAAAGSAGAVAHNMTNRAMNHVSKKRRARRIARRR